MGEQRSEEKQFITCELITLLKTDLVLDLICNLLGENWYKKVIKYGKNLIRTEKSIADLKDKFYSTLTNLKRVENN
jgi:hypothetical protein